VNNNDTRLVIFVIIIYHRHKLLVVMDISWRLSPVSIIIYLVTMVIHVIGEETSHRKSGRFARHDYIYMSGVSI
jgi:surface polysaccharide O-acyltransferase-like enzyme